MMILQACTSIKIGQAIETFRADGGEKLIGTNVLDCHPADSRAYQGIHGYQWAFEQGLPKTVVTVHLVDEGMDTGPILAQAGVDLRGAGSLAEVERRGLAVEHRFYSAVLADLLAGSI